MKLSEKGQKRIHKIIDCAFEAHPDDAKGVQVLAKKYLTECDDFEIQPDDFKGCVVLTVEEAKAVQEKLNTFLICAKPRYEKLMKKDINLLSKRIEQAESKK